MDIAPNTIHPLRLPNGEIWHHTVFLKNVINHLNIITGDFTYYNNFRKEIANYSSISGARMVKLAAGEIIEENISYIVGNEIEQLQTIKQQYLQKLNGN